MTTGYTIIRLPSSTTETDNQSILQELSALPAPSHRKAAQLCSWAQEVLYQVNKIFVGNVPV